MLANSILKTKIVGCQIVTRFVERNNLIGGVTSEETNSLFAVKNYSDNWG
jgi:hypothetical protein